MKSFVRLLSVSVFLFCLQAGGSLVGQNMSNNCIHSNFQVDREPSLRDPSFTFSAVIAGAARRHLGDDVSLYPASMTFQFDLDTTGIIQHTEFCKPQELNRKFMDDVSQQLQGQRVFTPAMQGGKAVPYKFTFRIACLLWRE
jgi:hypothetical protein